MSAGPSGAAAGLLLVIAGIWLLLQTIVAGLPGRLLNLNTSSSSSSSSGSGQSSSGSSSSSSASTATTSSSSSGGQSVFQKVVGVAQSAQTTPAQNVNNPKSPPAPY